jgi:HAMP domain-containing protein/CHASE3 domain sensor protein
MRFPLFSAKLGLAVALPTLAALFVGLFAVSRLDALADRAKNLETARLPRADLAAAVERRLLVAAQAIRGYALSGERETLERAKKELAQAADAVHAAREAADHPGMASLAVEAEKIGYFLDAYKKAAESSVSANERVADDRAALAGAAEKFAAAATAYADWKTTQWDKELAGKYPQPDPLRQHAKRLRGIQAAMTAGRDPQLAAESARAARDPALLVAAVPRLDDAESALRDLKGGDEDAKRLAPVFAALAEYRQAIATLLTDWEALRATGRQILEAERAALSAGTDLGGATLTEAASDAGNLATSLNRSRIWLVVASVIVAAAGLTFAVLAAVFLGTPVRRCAFFARDLAVGRVTGNLAAAGIDEVGLLADSLREMARRIGKHFAR